MKVSDSTNLPQNLPQVSSAQAANAKATQNTATAASSTASDKAQVSTVAKQVAQSASASDVRLDKVASIQKALLAGTYQVPASDVAQKVIQSMLATEK